VALDLTVTYPGQVDDTDPDYPQGAAVNVGTEGDGTGYPFEKTWVNDHLGFHQALLLAAGITPSGDPDNANVSQYKEAVEWIAAAAHNTFDPVVMFDAAGEIITELEDDTAELNACFAAAYAAIGGGNVTVDLGGRSYRVTGALTCYPHVNVKHGKIVMYHATANFLAWGTAATQRTATIWEDVDLSYAEANTGKVIVNTSGVVDVEFRNYRSNASGFCTGKLFECTTASKFRFIECIQRSATTGESLTSDAGELKIWGGEYTMAPDATVDMVRANRLVVGGGARFVHVSTVGDVSFITTSSSVRCCQVQGAEFDVDDSGAGGPTYAVSLVAGFKAQISDNDFFGDTLPYNVVSTPLAAGSRVQLLPQLASTTPDATASVPVWYESAAIMASNASPIDVELEDPLIRGQRLTVAVRNISGGAWTGVVGFIATAIAYTEAGGLTDLADDEIVTIDFVASVLDTGLTWVQVGDAAQHFVA
jgi:hypothetical protein